MRRWLLWTAVLVAISVPRTLLAAPGGKTSSSVYQQMSFTQIPGGAGNASLAFTFPADKRLVIQHISLRARTSDSRVSGMFIYYPAANEVPPGRIYLPFSAYDTLDGYLHNYLSSSPVTAYAEDGQVELVVMLEGAADRGGDVWGSVTGYLDEK